MDTKQQKKKEKMITDLLVKNRGEFNLLMDKLNLHGNAIEIGVDVGNYSEVLLTFGFKKLYLLDAWKEFTKEEYFDRTNASQTTMDKRYQLVVEKMKPHGDKVEIIRGDSRLEWKRFPDGFFDFVYIDANHEYRHVRKDIGLWWNKVKLGGVLAGHDYKNGCRHKTIVGVKKAVQEFCKKQGQQHVIVPRSERCPKSWYIIKE